MSNNRSGTPGKTELRSEVPLLCVIQSATGADAHVREIVGASAKHHRAQFAVLLRDRAKVLPAETGSHCQVGLHFVVVLNEKPNDVSAEIFAKRGRHAGLGIELR